MKRKIGPLLRRYFIGGLLVWLPIWATYIVVRFVVQIMDSTVNLLPEQYQPAQLFGFNVPGFGIFFTVAVIFITGLLVANFLGHRLLQLWEKILSRIPLVRSIYSAVKQVADALLHPQGNAFRKVLMIEYPRKGLWSICFQTAQQCNMGPLDENHTIVFVPTTPNPTSGFLIVVDKADTHELNISVEEGLRMVISLGVVLPDSIATAQKDSQNDTSH